MRRNESNHLQEADIEPLLSNLSFHRGREARVRELMREKLEKGADEPEDEMDDSELDRVAGGLQLPPEGRDPSKK